jgi:hypothetical protein
MPTCHRCNTPSLPSAEVRKTPKGFVHKDTFRCERIQKQLRVDASVRHHLDELEERWEALDRAYGSRDVMMVLNALGRFNAEFAELATATITSIASHNGKYYTQKQIAQALDIPPSALRGLKQSVR